MEQQENVQDIVVLHGKLTKQLHSNISVYVSRNTRLVLFLKKKYI